MLTDKIHSNIVIDTVQSGIRAHKVQTSIKLYQNVHTVFYVRHMGKRDVLGVKTMRKLLANAR